MSKNQEIATTILQQYRTLKLTHYEIELLQNALGYIYNRKLDIVSKNREILNENESDFILASANGYDDLRNKIGEGEKDV